MRPQKRRVMWSRFKKWWGGLSDNERLMYPLAAALVVGILTRWEYVWGQVGEAFGGLFSF